MKVYRTDCGHEMDEDDFFAYIIFLIEDFLKKGNNKEEAIIKIWERNFLGDSIIDQGCFENMKLKAINYFNAIIPTTYEK